MPVPPIYVIEQDEGRYLLIDGLQRISSYLHLRGELEATHLDPPIHRGEKLTVVECDIVEELNGKTFTHYRLIIGSSEYDTKQMAQFIDGIVSEAKELGIETLTPAELAVMCERVGK
jgi:hypothetical protein